MQLKKTLINRFLPLIDKKILSLQGAFYYLQNQNLEKMLNSPVQNLRISKTAITLAPLIFSLAPYAKKILLNGSRGKGINRNNDVYELTVVSNHATTVRQMIKKYSIKLNSPLRVEIFHPTEAFRIESQNMPQSDLLSSGIVLWQSPNQIIDLEK